MAPNPIRILHCIHSLAGGGAERQLCLLARASQAFGMVPALFCVDDRAHLPLDGVTVIKSGQRNSKDPRVFGAIGRAIGVFAPDVVHAWLPGSMTIPALAMAARHRLPAVFSYRNEQRFRRGLFVAEYVAALLLADAVVSNTPAERSNALYRYLYRRKGGVRIANAVHVPHPPGTLAAPVPGEEGVFTILFVGRLTHQKNWQGLLDAAALVRAPRPWRLLLCGDGEDRAAAAARIAHLGLDGKAFLLGYREDAYALMAEADLLLLPSWFEGMPNVLLEAFASGLPAFASDIGAVRELVGRSPCVRTFDPADPGALARLIESALADPSILPPLAAAGRELAKAFSVEAMAAAYRAFYSDLLDRKGRARGTIRG